MGVKEKAAVSIAVAPLLAWLAVEVYEMKEDVTASRVRIEALTETVDNQTDSINELIRLHLRP